MDKKIVTRFAPSPTGRFHVGSYRTALVNYLIAKQQGGEFVLRIEDTDRERSTKEYENEILESLSWLGLTHDTFYRQSEQAGKHREILEKLITEDKAYISQEEGGKSKEVIRFRNAGKKVTFNDLIPGEITFDTTELGDFVIAKNLDEPLFHLAVVADDILAGITHIIRGEDHISNTPRQILIWEAIGAAPALYAHLPLVLAPDRSKLSKRHGAEPVIEFREQGVLPEALLNYMALLGWNPGTEKEIFTREELVQEFSLGNVQKAGAIYDRTRLFWFNREHMLRMPPEVYEERLKDALKGSNLPQNEHLWQILLPLLKERITRFGEAKELLETELRFLENTPQYEPALLLWKKEPDAAKTAERLSQVLGLIEKGEENLTPEGAKALIWEYAEKEGKGEVLWPLRVALTGQERSPDPFTVTALLGKNQTIERINTAIKNLLQ